MATTYNNLYLDARKRLKEAGIESAQLEAREIVCYAADKTREQFFRDLALYASDPVEKRVRELLERRLAGEPVAYIIGEWEFYGLPLDMDRNVLIPRMDTELLAERAILLARAAGEGARVLDLCAGSGCVGLAVAANVPACRVVLADLSEEALKVCKQNVRRNDLNARVTCVLADAKEKPDPVLWDFDVIVCNPPYIPSGTFRAWTCRCGTTSPAPLWTAVPTGWTFTGPSPPDGAPPSGWAAGCCSKWGSGRPRTWSIFWHKTGLKRSRRTGTPRGSGASWKGP